MNLEPQLPKLEIVLNPNGTVSVTGPIHDRVLSYGMLELAKVAINEYHAKQVNVAEALKLASTFSRKP